jgi:hypothetical protein
MRVAVGLMSGFLIRPHAHRSGEAASHPNELQDLDAAPCGIKVNSGNVAYVEFEFNLLNPNLMAAPCAVPIIQ